jgi:LuxR family transcriptional regulator, regulator of acetate metabolism
MTLVLHAPTREPYVAVDDPHPSSLHCDQCSMLRERLEEQAEEVRILLQAIETVVSRSSRGEPRNRDEALTQPEAPIHAKGQLTSSRASLPLARREFEVLRLMAQGATNDRVACTLGISPGTVKTHVKNILRKLDASNRAEAVCRLVSTEPQPSETAWRNPPLRLTANRA